MSKNLVANFVKFQRTSECLISKLLQINLKLKMRYNSKNVQSVSGGVGQPLFEQFKKTAILVESGVIQRAWSNHPYLTPYSTIKEVRLKFRFCAALSNLIYVNSCWDFWDREIKSLIRSLVWLLPFLFVNKEVWGCLRSVYAEKKMPASGETKISCLSFNNRHLKILIGPTVEIWSVFAIYVGHIAFLNSLFKSL